MPISREVLATSLTAAFPDAKITIEDLAGDNDHWAVEIVSPVFAGKSRIAQHRMVQEALGDKEIHALSIKTRS